MKDHLAQLVQGSAPPQGRNLAREYLQSYILSAFQRAGAMTCLAFQGGTCLCFVFGLPGYSEDLDFALEGDRGNYDLRAYLRGVRAELGVENYSSLDMNGMVERSAEIHRQSHRKPDCGNRRTKQGLNAWVTASTGVIAMHTLYISMLNRKRDVHGPRKTG